MGEYEKIYDFEHLYQAHKLARRGKGDKFEVIDFEMNLFENLCSLQEELYRKTYRIAGYHKFTIYDPKIRQIQALSYRDRIVQHSLCDNVLMPFFERHLIYDNSACRIGKGTHFSMNRLVKFLQNHYKQYGAKGYFLKCDIRKYFDSVYHMELKTRLHSKIKEEEVYWLLERIIGSYEKTPGRGLPMGNQTSQWFALFYLDPLDRLIKEKLKITYYTRYMDDCILIHPNKAYLKECLAKMTELIEGELKLEFNEKTQIIPIKNGVEYLGFRFYLTDTGKVIKRLKTASKKRFKRRLKKFQKDYRENKVEFKTISQSIASYKGHLKHGHTYKLKKKIFQEFVLSKSSQNHYR